MPPLVIVPPAVPSCTDQVTARLLDPVTVAVKTWVPAAGRLSADLGEMLTVTLDGSGGGEGGLAAPLPPQPVTAQQRPNHSSIGTNNVFTFMARSLPSSVE